MTLTWTAVAEITDMGFLDLVKIDSARPYKQYIVLNYPDVISLLPRAFRITLEDDTVYTFVLTPEEAEELLK
jgi:hypothetical protein